jgi:GNAT superfamily N-acetyltransferase
LLAQQIERGEVFLAFMGGELAASVTLQQADETIWEDSSETAAAYVHRFVVRRKLAGQSIGLRLLRWAEQTAAAAGKQFLRLDCWSGNQALCHYYEQAGFASRGERYVQIGEDNYHTHCFEKTLGP